MKTSFPKPCLQIITTAESKLAETEAQRAGAQQIQRLSLPGSSLHPPDGWAHKHIVFCSLRTRADVALRHPSLSFIWFFFLSVLSPPPLSLPLFCLTARATVTPSCNKLGCQTWLSLAVFTLPPLLHFFPVLSWDASSFQEEEILGVQQFISFNNNSIGIIYCGWR